MTFSQERKICNVRWCTKVAVIALVFAAAGACDQGASRDSEAGPVRSRLVGTEEYLPGVEADPGVPLLSTLMYSPQNRRRVVRRPVSRRET